MVNNISYEIDFYLICVINNVSMYNICLQLTFLGDLKSFSYFIKCLKMFSDFTKNKMKGKRKEIFTNIATKVHLNGGILINNYMENPVTRKTLQELLILIFMPI